MSGEFTDDDLFDDDVLDDEGGEVLLSKQQIAHDRGRICKKRGCVVCQPLREQRQAKKRQRKDDAQAARHAKNQPCGRASCTVDRCVTSRQTAEERSAPAAREGQQPRTAAAAPVDQELVRRRRDEKHQLGLACGAEDCSIQRCVDGFARERANRHRKGRPCRSASCETAICVAARSSR